MTTRRPSRLLGVLAAAVAAPSVAAPEPATAGTFTHIVCAHPETRVGTGVTNVEGLTEEGAGSGWQLGRSCAQGQLLGSFEGFVVRRASGGGSAAAGSWRGLRYGVDRPGLRLAGATYWRAVSSSASTTGEIRWGQHAAAALADPFAAPAHPTERGMFVSGYQDRGSNNSPLLFGTSNRVTPVIADNAFSVSLACATPATACSGSLSYYLFGAAAVIEDEHAPQLTAAIGALMQDDRLAGAPAGRLSLADRGAGLHRVRLSLDGTPLRTVDVAPADSRCRDVHPGNADPREFTYQVPCPLTADVDVSLPLYEASDGRHRLTVTAEDAAGNAATVADRTIVVDNVPAPELDPEDPPAILGDATVGLTLTVGRGTWWAATGVGLQWLRCHGDASESPCTPIAGATQRTYTPDREDAGRHLRVRTTARNAIGETAEHLSPASPAVSTPVVPEPETEIQPAEPKLSALPAAPQPPRANAVIRTETVFVPVPLAAIAAPVANGHGATPQARLVLRRGGRRAQRLQAPCRDTVTVQGRLTDRAGRPIGAALLDVTATDRQRLGGVQSLSAARTRPDGTFAYRIGCRPREVTFAYRHATGAQASRRATLAVRPRARRVGQRLLLGRIAAVSTEVP